MSEEIESTGPVEEAVNMSQTKVDHVEAQVVRMSQSQAKTIHAQTVEVRQSVVARLDAEQVEARQGAFALVRADLLTAVESAVTLASAGELKVEKGHAIAVYANETVFNQSQANFLATRRVSGDRINAIVLLSGRVEGTVETAFDTPRALLAGLAAGAGMGLLLMMGRLLRGR